MFLVFLLGLVVLLCEFIGKWVHPVVIDGYMYPPVIFILPIISPLRDLIQQRKHRVHALIAMAIAVVVFYFTTTLNRATIAAAALVWTELIDFVLYTVFRRFGWLVGVVVSDIVAVPILLPLYVIFAGYSISLIPQHLYVGEFIVLAVVYAVVLLTPIRNLFTGIPMIRRRREA